MADESFDNTNGNQDDSAQGYGDQQWDFQGQKRKREGDDYGAEPKRRNDEDEIPDSTKYELRILLQTKNAGAVIGKGGQNIETLRKKYNAGIFVPDCKGSERILSIQCGYGKALEAMDEIIPCLEDYQHFKGQGQDNFECELRMLVPQSQIGCVIGKKGFTIKSLREETKTKIKVYPELCPNSQDRVVSVYGERPLVIQCIKRIIQKILEQPASRGPPEPYDPRNVDPEIHFIPPYEEYGGYMPERQRGSGGGRGYGSDMGGGGYDGGWGGGRRGGPGPRGEGGMGRDRGPRDMGGRGGRGGGGRGGRGGGPRGVGGSQGFSMRNDFDMGFNQGGPGMGGPNMRSMGGPNMGGPSNMGGPNMGGNMDGNMGGNMSGNMGPGGNMNPLGNMGNQMGNQMGSLMGSQNFTQDTMSGCGNQGLLFGQGQMSQSTTNNQTGQTTQRVTIPKHLAGAIIGRGGHRIQAVRVQSKASIVIDEAPVGSNDRIITITGHPQEIENAQYLLQKCVHENAHEHLDPHDHHDY